MKQKAFSIMEMVLVMVIVGILVVGIGSFLTYDEQTRRYKAETCLNQLNGELQGFMKAAMTSKALKSGNQLIFPDYYLIEFSGATEINFAYSGASGKGVYQKIDLKKFCDQKEVSLSMTGQHPSFSGVVMNKSFRQIKPQEICTFSLGDCQKSFFTGWVQFNICMEDSCPKEYGAWMIDARAQTVSPVTCRFYDLENQNQCVLWDVER